MKFSKLFTISVGILVSAVTFASTTGWAKEKTGGTTPLTDVEWIDRSSLIDLLPVGAFWCMVPQGDTCAFSALVTKSEGNQFSYLVTSFWDGDVLLAESYDAYVTDASDLCEPRVLNFKRMIWTDLSGQPLGKAQQLENRQELRDWFGDEEKPDQCFRISARESEDGMIFTQFTLDENNNPVDPLEFLVDYSANAANNYSLRWEN